MTASAGLRGLTCRTPNRTRADDEYGEKEHMVTERSIVGEVTISKIAGTLGTHFDAPAGRHIESQCPSVEFVPEQRINVPC